MVERVAQHFVDRLVHPVFVLAVAVVSEVAVGLDVVEELFDAFPYLFQSRSGYGRAGVDFGPPARFRQREEPQRPLKLGFGEFGLVDVFAVGLGDYHDVGHLHDAALDALQLVARARNLQQHEHVDHRMYGRFGLSDAHRLDEDHVESRGFAQHDRLARLAGHAAQRSRRGRRADEDVGIARNALHAGFVAENRAAAAFRRRVDGQHGELVPQRGDHVADGFDEGRFSGSGDARDADADRFPGVRQAALDDLLRLRVVRRVVGLDERDGLRKGGDVAGENALDVLVGRELRLLAAREVRVYDRLIFNAFGDVQSRVVVHVGVLFFVMVYLGERHVVICLIYR